MSAPVTVEAIRAAGEAVRKTAEGTPERAKAESAYRALVAKLREETSGAGGASPRGRYRSGVAR